MAKDAKPKMFLDVPAAAELAGYSIRHMRRLIEEEHIPIVCIGRRFFILRRDFDKWKETHVRKTVTA